MSSCDLLTTVNPALQIAGLSSFSAPPVGAGFNSLATVAALLQANIPGTYTCADVPGLLNSLIGAGSNIFLAPDSYLVQPPSVGDFSLNGGANGSVVFDVQFGGTSQGHITCTFVAGVPTLTNGSSWTAPKLASDFNGSLGIARVSFSGDEIIYRGKYPAVTSFPDMQGYINCAIPVCGVPILTYVQIQPPGIKLVNFSRFVNPFGIKGI